MPLTVRIANTCYPWPRRSCPTTSFPQPVATLEEALDEDSNDGRANLLMARLMAAGRALQRCRLLLPSRDLWRMAGQFAGTAAAKVRLELAGLLAEHGGNQELLSELLLLQNEPDQDLATKKQIAALFLQAGSAEHAADAYRRLIREDRDDADVFAGLGQAEILAGNYRAAENAFLGALRRRLDDPHIQSQLGDGRQTRHSRSDFAASQLRREISPQRGDSRPDPSELNACLRNAAPAKAEKIRGPITNEMAEARLDQAEKLWKQREEACKQPLYRMTLCPC